ncbi:RRP12-like protein [Bombus impatiens]|uniref:RRP12-like protein n=1 Tax=Bombus impatiens TaxID=132113 RepID=A0A6P6FEH9_BOMIM|nr:RRP12-like protein [Bombus impatiens]
MSQAMDKKRKYNDSYNNVSVRSGSTLKYQAGGSGIYRPLKKSRTECIPGAKYKASKAGGVVKKERKTRSICLCTFVKSSIKQKKKEEKCE